MTKRHVIELNGVTFHLHASGALFTDDHCVFVADLHLEQGTSLARRGVHVPPFDTVSTLEKLDNLLSEVGARKLYLLGDSFHDATAQQEFSFTSNIETIWISGNHDPGAVTEASYKGILLRHEPLKEFSGFEIAGHLHPGATVIQRDAAVRGKCFVSDAHRIILPAFGAYTGAFDLRNQAFEGLFDKKIALVHVIGRNAIFKLPIRRVC